MINIHKNCIIIIIAQYRPIGNEGLMDTDSSLEMHPVLEQSTTRTQGQSAQPAAFQQLPPYTGYSPVPATFQQASNNVSW